MPYPVEAWHGARDAGRRVRDARPGDVLAELGFLSASLDREVGEDFAASHFNDGVLLRLLIPAGLRGVGYVHRVPREQAPEAELLLRRGLRLRVVGQDRKSTVLEVLR